MALELTFITNYFEEVFYIAMYNATKFSIHYTPTKHRIASLKKI